MSERVTLQPVLSSGGEMLAHYRVAMDQEADEKMKVFSGVFREQQRDASEPVPLRRMLVEISCTAVLGS